MESRADVSEDSIIMIDFPNFNKHRHLRQLRQLRQFCNITSEVIDEIYYPVNISPFHPCQPRLLGEGIGIAVHLIHLISIFQYSMSKNVLYF